jgi:PAS domain S-box-containing protein
MDHRPPAQNAPSDGPHAGQDASFLAGGGFMGALIRAHDWAATPLGAPATWPQSLRTTVRLLLTTRHPVFIFWGAELTCLYNDAYSASLGAEKHPSILGAPGAEAFAEAWHHIGPDVDAVTAGQGACWYEDRLVPIQRHGRHDEVYWTYSYSPIDDETLPSGIGGVLVLCTETTQRVLAERRQSLLMRLGDALRDLTDPDHVMARAAAMLGSNLGASCIGYSEADSAATSVTVTTDWTAPGAHSVVGTHILDHFGAMAGKVRKGEIIRIDDVTLSPDTATPPVHAAFAAIGVRALICVPLMHGERLSGTLFAFSPVARAWSDSEVSLVAEVANRTRASVSRARAERALRQSESLLRNIGECSGDPIFVKDRQGRMIYANSQLLHLIGKPAEEILGRDETGWHSNPEEAAAIMANDQMVMTTGEGYRIEEAFTPAEGRERFFESTKSPMRDADGNVIGLVGVAIDITERRQNQKHLALLVDELNHRVKNTLTIVQAIAQQTFRRGDMTESGRRAFEGRLAALAAAHTLLTDRHWENAELADVIATACRAHGGIEDRFTVSGPNLKIPPKTAVTIAMALHELCTNAVKYGALSVPDGHVFIDWSIAPETEPRLKMSWRETGGPAVVPPQTRGFGSRMIERALAIELRGTVRLNFLPSGLLCTIDAPLGF